MIALFVWLGDLDSFRMPHCYNGYIHGKFWYIINKLCAVKWLAGCVAISSSSTHDDVIKWKHFPRYWPFVQGIHRSPVNSPHKGQWRGALMFSLIWAWINGWVNNREAGDLRRHRTHCDVTVIGIWIGCYRLHHEYALGRLCLGFLSKSYATNDNAGNIV